MVFVGINSKITYPLKISLFLLDQIAISIQMSIMFQIVIKFQLNYNKESFASLFQIILLNTNQTQLLTKSNTIQIIFINEYQISINVQLNSNHKIIQLQLLTFLDFYSNSTISPLSINLNEITIIFCYQLHIIQFIYLF